VSGAIADPAAFPVLRAAGSYAVLLRGKPGDTVTALFGGYGRRTVSFEA
jgi:hypothetical protein